ncbi:uncharacterized protein LOC124171003 isoform X2 [Ischnura elegans]|uniref:uncharacterized protein LOC124171003 isoform X2 n=1 Tax=Ischnura elegans TaxID=197161 RepID=UPI001ED87C9E|nr:uncharacterized protein LOC124171003 isoform X2 [Ischnura elegans]
MKGGGSELGGFPPLTFLGPGQDEASGCGNLPLRPEDAYDELPRGRSPRRVAPALPPSGSLVPTAARLLLMAAAPPPSCPPGAPSSDPEYSSNEGGSDDSGEYGKAEYGELGALEDTPEGRTYGDGFNDDQDGRDSDGLDQGALYSDFWRKSVLNEKNTAPDFVDSSSLYRRKNLKDEPRENGSHEERISALKNMRRDFSKLDDRESNVKITVNGNLPSVRGLRNHFESLPVDNSSSPPPPPVSPDNKPWMTNGQKPRDTNRSSPVDTSPLRKVNVNHDLSKERKKASMVNCKDGSEEYVSQLRKFTLNWNPESLMDKLYSLHKVSEKEFNSHRYINISGTLDKLPSGRKKATFWNAWKSRYFKAENGLLKIFQKNSSETPLMTMQLMGGKVEVLKPIGMDENMLRNCTLLGIDDGKGHYVVVKCPNEVESNAWMTALQTQVVENYESTYAQPVSLINGPSCTKDTIIIDLGSCSLRAGVLTTQPSFPQIFFPSVMAVHKETNERWYGLDAVSPVVRSESRMCFPIRPSAKITKYSVDLDGCYGLIEKVFSMLAVQPEDYNVFLCVPRSFNSHTLSSIVNTMFEKWRVKSLSVSHQSVLTLYAYNARSGIVVDIGERTDVIPISEGYILERGVSRTPYGSHQVIEMLKQLLNEKNYSFPSDVETYLVRYIVENLCYCAQNYSSEHKEAMNDIEKVKKEISIKEVYCDANFNVDSISLDIARFHAPEGLFNPDIWGHDNIGVHKMVHKGIQECSMDIRKEMIRSIYLSGGVTMIPGFASRLLLEIDKLTPPSITPKVHASPYRYHAAYIGACVLAISDQVSELTVRRQEWMKSGADLLRKWNI